MPASMDLPYYEYQEKVSLQQLFADAAQDYAFPGGCLIAGSATRTFVKQCFGYHTYEQKIKNQLDSLFDISSLTKVVATTTAIMRYYEQQRLNLDDCVTKYIPEFCGPNAEQTNIKSQISIWQLLSHTSGAAAYNFDALKFATQIQRLQALYKTPLSDFPNSKTIYSDINFVLLGKIIEKLSGETLDQHTKNYIFSPLNMQNTQFNPSDRSHCVPTLNTTKISVINDPAYMPPTPQCLCGVVNDPTARGLNGVAGNAGLFSTIEDLGIFASMLLNHGQYGAIDFLKKETIDLFTSRVAIPQGSSRALGWDTVYYPLKKQPSQFSAGLYIDADGYGHTGYTGTSMWLSRRYGIYVILLTNRTYPDNHNHTLAQYYYRQKINSAVWQNLGFNEKNHLAVIHWKKE